LKKRDEESRIDVLRAICGEKGTVRIAISSTDRYLHVRSRRRDIESFALEAPHFSTDGQELEAHAITVPKLKTGVR
jgi:hypothetical protein